MPSEFNQMCGGPTGDQSQTFAQSPVNTEHFKGVSGTPGSTSKQLPFDQLEGCLIGFVEDGQKVHS